MVIWRCYKNFWRGSTVMQTKGIWEWVLLVINRLYYQLYYMHMQYHIMPRMCALAQSSSTSISAGIVLFHVAQVDPTVCCCTCWSHKDCAVFDWRERVWFCSFGCGMYVDIAMTYAFVRFCPLDISDVSKYHVISLYVYTIEMHFNLTVAYNGHTAWTEYNIMLKCTSLNCPNLHTSLYM